MPRKLSITLYSFDELSQKAQKKAIEALTENPDAYPPCDWAEYTLEDFHQICRILGFDIIDPNRIVPDEYPPADALRIAYCAGHCQSDGASFAADYQYARGAHKRIREFTDDKTLHHMADSLFALQKRNFYLVSARITMHGQGVHHSSMRAAVARETPSGMLFEDEPDIEHEILSVARPLAAWLYNALIRQREWYWEDEAKESFTRECERDFLIDGEPFEHSVPPLAA